MQVNKMSEEFPSIVILPLDRIDVKEFDPRIEQTQYWVEANSDAYYQLWQRFSFESDQDKFTSKIYNWKGENTIIFMSIGSWYVINCPEEKHAITIDIRWAIINNIRVGFYTSSSIVSHQGMVEHFLKLHSPSYRFGLFENAANFNPGRMVDDIESFKIYNDGLY